MGLIVVQMLKKPADVCLYSAQVEYLADFWLGISVWICKNMPQEIKHILRLSRLMEYASPEQDSNSGSS